MNHLERLLQAGFPARKPSLSALLISLPMTSYPTRSLSEFQTPSYIDNISKKEAIAKHDRHNGEDDEFKYVHLITLQMHSRCEHGVTLTAYRVQILSTCLRCNLNPHVRIQERPQGLILLVYWSYSTDMRTAFPAYFTALEIVTPNYLG